jgi:divalent metal cation (Fe/Co/Zn/Cd) transporter
VLSGIHALDAVLAAIVGVYILWAGWRLVKESVGGLMDAAPPPDVAERIGRAIAESGGGALQAHDIRMRRAGRATFIDFHLVVPGSITVSAAHRICDRIEAALRAEVEGAITTIHVEPDEKAKARGAMRIG